MAEHRRVAILAERDGWHFRQLAQAFDRQHGVSVQRVDPALIRIDASFEQGIAIPGYEEGLPDAVVVRGIPAGSFEAVTLRLGVLHALSRVGVAVINTASAIERTVDKSACSQILQASDIATPPMLATDRPELARQWLTGEFEAGHQVVVKPLFGAEGKGITRLSAGQSLAPPTESGGVWYLQRYLHGGQSSGGRDIRILVIGDQPAYAMQREHPVDWVTNVARGARCLPWSPDPTMQTMAVAAARAVGADVAGVDLMIDAHDKPWVIEVNSVPAWSGLQSISEERIADAIAAQVVKQMQASQ